MVSLPIATFSFALALSFGGVWAVRHVTPDEGAKMLAEEVEWQDLWCIQHRIAGNSCPEAVQAIEKQCAAWKKEIADAATSQVRRAQLALDPKCGTFYKEQRECKEQALQRESPQKLKGVVRQCEAAVHEVCATTVCPAYCALKNNAGPCKDCVKTCAAVEQNMFDTGSLECAEGEEWAKCLHNFQDGLSEQGRFPEMEALMREHLVKCVCVSARDDTSVCYNDEDDVGLGISQGQKWCEFYKTPSWRKLLAGISSEEAKSRGLVVQDRWTAAPSCEAKVSGN